MTLQTSIQQIYIFFLFMLVGIVIAIVFDIFRILRRTFTTPDWLTYVEDIAFWLLAGFFILYAIFVWQNGEIRLYLFIAILLGSVLYMVTLSKYVIQICVKVLSILVAPFQKLFAFFAKIMRKIAKKWFPARKKEKKQPKFYIFLKKFTEKRRILGKHVEKNN